MSQSGNIAFDPTASDQMSIIGNNKIKASTKQSYLLAFQMFSEGLTVNWLVNAIET